MATVIEETLIEKIAALPPERRAEVVDFVDFLLQRAEQQDLYQFARLGSEASFTREWDNPEDDVYNDL